MITVDLESRRRPHSGDRMPPTMGEFLAPGVACPQVSATAADFHR